MILGTLKSAQRITAQIYAHGNSCFVYHLAGVARTMTKKEEPMEDCRSITAQRAGRATQTSYRHASALISPTLFST
jgi:hypothetical protein